MSDQDTHLSQSERETLEQLVQQTDSLTDGQRARALLAMDAGQTQAAAAEVAGLTTGQLTYFLRKFREERLAAFSSVSQAALTSMPETGLEEQSAALREVIDELNSVLRQLQALIPDSARSGLSSTYSPQSILVLIRDNFNKLTPDMQLDVLRNLQGMSPEDFLDIDTWKGMGYMMTYSARFQTTQILGKVEGVVNQVVPEPIQPRRLWGFARRTVDRVTPEFAKQIVGTFRDATVSDLTDMDTWKGVWYMIAYSIQFQAEQMRDRLVEIENNRHAA